MMIYVVLIFLALTCCTLELWRPVHRRWFSKSWRNHLPNGPPGVPLIGSLGEFRAARRQGKLMPWLLSLREHGEMTTLHMGSQLWVVLNSDRVARDIISKHANITNERPSMPIANGTVSNGRRSVVQHAVAWQSSRRLMRHLLNREGMDAFTSWQDLESIRMLQAYLHAPEKWFQHQARYAMGILHGVVLGEALSKSNEEMAEYREVTRQFLGSIFDSWIDFFPFLRYLPRPLQVWRHHWEDIGHLHRRVFEKWWCPTREKIANGEAGPSFMRDVLLNPTTGPSGSETDALYLANSLISAGSDNTRMTLDTFVLAIVTCPDAFTIARRELDAVCGMDMIRLPNVADIPSMRYLCALIKELLRWRPIVPLLLPRQLTEELHYEKYVFPKNTNFLVNSVAICADCEEPTSFKPERWLDGNETKLEHGFWGFGGGRRICIGYRAEQPALFLALARLIYCFDFQAGGPINPKFNPWSSEEPFPVKVAVRSGRHSQLIRKEAMRHGI